MIGEGQEYQADPDYQHDECLQAPQLVCASIILRCGLASADGGEFLKHSHTYTLSLEGATTSRPPVQAGRTSWFTGYEGPWLFQRLENPSGFVRVQGLVAYRYFDAHQRNLSRTQELFETGRTLEGA